MKKILLTLLLLLTAVTSSQAQTGRQRDSLALREFYTNLDGANWTNQTNWMSNNPINTWYGVTVNSSFNRVTHLSLYNNGLLGSMPLSIGSLDSLSYVYFGFNSMSGTLPDTLFQLRALISLDLYGQRYHDPHGFTGTLSYKFQQLTRLVTLDLGANKFSGTIPTFWNTMLALRALRIYQNEFTGTIPPELANATQLTELNISSNYQLTAGALPTAFASMPNLQFLYLGNCNINSLPNLSADTSLFQLSLGGNQLTGAIPSWIGGLTKLQGLDLGGNNFSADTIPGFIYNMTNLTSLQLYNCNRTGSISPLIGNLTNLSSLDLGGNQLTGQIPSQFGTLSNMGYMNLSYNQFTGALPFLNMPNVYYFYLNNNKLSGLPALTGMTGLGSFYAQNNQFTFEDIQPNIGRASNTFQYAPQDSVGILRDTLVASGVGITMSVASIPVGGTAKSYQWLKDGVT
ncbi:hypothetical protein JNM05_10290, partial [bacterium]|nr:hypothetical protein [bacterium]